MRFHRHFIPTSHSLHIFPAGSKASTPLHPMRLRLFAISLLLAATAHACLNTPGTALDGHASGSRHAHDASTLRRSIRMTGPNPGDLRFDEPAASPAKQLEREALLHIYAGEYAAARPLLEKAEAAGPGDYSVAANLGTVCELLGDNTSALQWIDEAMRRNPGSHRGTEWVHVLVLKAKLHDASLPASAPQRPPLLEVPERIDAGTPLVIDGVTRPASQVREAVLYQLRERLVFVKPQDRYVADLLFALARLNANLVNIESASGILDLAEDYGYANAARIDALRDDIDRARRKAALRSAAYWIAGLGAFGGLMACAYRRKWLFLSRAAYEAHRSASRRPPATTSGERSDMPKKAAPPLETCDR